MTNGEIRVERLMTWRITDTALDEINQLLKKQRHDARELTQDGLHEKMNRMGVAVARDCQDHIVGIGVITCGEGLNFRCGEIRHLVINDPAAMLSVGMRIVEELKKIYPHNIDYIDAGVWVQDPEMKGIFEALGFKAKPGSRYRLRMK